MDNKTELHSILLVIKSKLDAGTLPMKPICPLVEEEADYRRLPFWAMEDYLKSLLHHEVFPVRESLSVSPLQSFEDYYLTSAMWDANHPYGAARRKLLADLIEQTKE